MQTIQIQIMTNPKDEPWGWQDPERKVYLDGLNKEERTLRLGMITAEQRIRYLGSLDTEDVVQMLDAYLNNNNDDVDPADREQWMQEAKGVLRSKVDGMDADELYRRLGESADWEKAMFLEVMEDEEIEGYMKQSSTEDKVAFLRGLRSKDPAMYKEYLEELLDSDREALAQLVADMSKEEQISFVTDLDTAEAADILETMDELARIACLRNLPIPVQVEILRAFNE